MFHLLPLVYAIDFVLLSDFIIRVTTRRVCQIMKETIQFITTEFYALSLLFPCFFTMLFYRYQSPNISIKVERKLHDFYMSNIK